MLKQQLSVIVKPYLGHAKLVAVPVVVVMAFGWFHWHVPHFRNRSEQKESVRASAQNVDNGVEMANLLDKDGWKYVPGTTIQEDGVQVSHIDRAIVEQDGSDNQEHPPVNYSGSHLEVSGEFVLKAGLKQAVSGGAVVRFYGSPPVVYDEWRYETPSIELRIAGDRVTARVWDGKSDEPRIEHTIETTVPDDFTLGVARRSGQLVISVNNDEIGQVAEGKVFQRGNVWVGVDANPRPASWTLTSLDAEGRNGGKVKVVPPPTLVGEYTASEALRNLLSAKHPQVKIGAAVATVPLLTDTAYRNLAVGQFNSWTPENELKPQFVHPLPDVYTFGEADLLVDTALANDIAVHGHTLVFGEANPRWIQDAPRASRQKIMTDHITAVVSHFKGKIAEWDVVNEPLSDYEDTGDGLRHHLWYEAMGEQYIDIAFKAAKAADPAAKLYINDFGLEADDERWDEFIALLQRLQSRGVPIDGVGFQAHVYEPADRIKAQTLKEHMGKLKALGLLVRISEIDVYGTRSSTQATEFASAFNVCITSSNCSGFSTWGITDKYGSTTGYHEYPLGYGDNLLWDTNYRPKLALTAILSSLK